ncbi:transmembrane protein 179B [Salmo salar]|uniref:Transmembrane protein 179B n=1 Tax=Salmo salar TaxID=8030 RepID=A0A1S3L135_SALSA|nr:transmembrane protein 179B-like [Salmo salar]|eukprot:XP_013984628.1 PREDICTED: transmembrane protein 179B-like [Salmo salar]
MLYIFDRNRLIYLDSEPVRRKEFTFTSLGLSIWGLNVKAIATYPTISLDNESPILHPQGKTVAECYSGRACEDIVLTGGVRDRLFLSALQSVPSITSRDADHKTWVSLYDGNQFYTGVYNAEKSVWVNFFWVLSVAVVFVQEHQGSGSEWSTSETEPFFHRPV